MQSKEIRNALRSGNHNDISSAYKSAWDAGSTPEMDGSILVALLRDQSRSGEALRLLESTRAARQTIENTAESPGVLDTIVGSPGWEDRYVWRVLFRARGLDESLQLWLAERFRANAGQRGDLASAMTEAVCDHVDGWEAPRLITGVWRHHSLIQQEQVSILRALANHDVLTRETFAQLRSHTPY